MRACLLSISAAWLFCAVSYAAEPPAPGGQAKDQAPAVRSRHGELGIRKLHWLEAGPASGLPVLLLHGQRFHSATWRKLGTIERLANEGFHVIALDLPGHGASPPAKGISIDLAEFITTQKLAPPVVLAPSMSARFALPLVTEHTEKVAGFVAVAPVDLPKYESQLRELTLPTLIFWGENDQVLPVHQGRDLNKWVKDSRLVVLPGAKHPCYLDRPEEFHAELVKFVSSVAAKRRK